MLTTLPLTAPSTLPPRRRGGQPSNRNALKHGLYAAKNHLPLPAHLNSIKSSKPGLNLDPAVIDQAIRSTQSKLRDYFLAWSKPESPEALLAWNHPVEKAIRTIEKLSLASSHCRYALRHLQLAASRPLDLLRWGFARAGIVRDADSWQNPPSNIVSTERSDQKERGRSAFIHQSALEGIERSDCKERRQSAFDSQTSFFLTAEQWALIAPIIPSMTTNQRGRPSRSCSIPETKWRGLPAGIGHPGARRLRGRPEADPRRLLDAIFWKFAHHARWSDLPPWAPPMLTCRRYYRRHFLSGRLFTLYKALYRDFVARDGTSLLTLVQQGCFTSTGREILLAEGVPETWQMRTALLFLQQSWRLSCCLLRDIDREDPPRSKLIHLPSRPITVFPLLHFSLPSFSDPTGPRAQIPNQPSKINDLKSGHSFREKRAKSDFYSPSLDNGAERSNPRACPDFFVGERRRSAIPLKS